MRAARYSSYGWHKRNHDAALKRVSQLAERIEEGENAAGQDLVKYLTSWLHSHTRMADMMLGSFLRNRQRGLCKITLRAGTKPANACAWVDSNGERFDPSAKNSGY